MEAPEERFAALLGGHETVLAAEELVLQARADLDAGRPRGRCRREWRSRHCSLRPRMTPSEHRESVVRAAAAASTAIRPRGRGRRGAMEAVQRRRRLRAAA